MIEIPSLVQWLLKNFADAMPIRTIREYERGVKYRRGIADRKDLRPGIHGFWPILQSISVVSIAEQVDKLNVQSLTTLDGKSIGVRFNIKYTVWSAWRTEIAVHNAFESLYAEVEGLIAEGVSAVSWKDLLSLRDALDKSVLETVKDKVHKWGFKVIDITIMEIVQATHYRVFGDTNTNPMLVTEEK